MFIFSNLYKSNFIPEGTTKKDFHLSNIYRLANKVTMEITSLIVLVGCNVGEETPNNVKKVVVSVCECLKMSFQKPVRNKQHLHVETIFRSLAKKLKSNQ